MNRRGKCAVSMKTLKTSAALLVLTLASAIAQTNWPGYIDPSFNATCISNAAYNHPIKGILVQGDGKIIAAGSFANFPGIDLARADAIFRCDSDGAPDNTFSSPFVVFSGINAIAPASGGKLLAAGNVTVGDKTVAIARLQANGAADGGFALTQTNPPGSSRLLGVRWRRINRPHRSWGSFGQCARLPQTFEQRRHGRWNVRGVIAGGFGGITALAIQPDNKVIIGGGFTNVSGTARLGFARINENGTTDPAFQSPFTTIYAVGAINLLANGQMLVTGNFATNESSLIVLARLIQMDRSMPLSRPSRAAPLALRLPCRRMEKLSSRTTMAPRGSARTVSRCELLSRRGRHRQSRVRGLGGGCQRTCAGRRGKRQFEWHRTPRTDSALRRQCARAHSAEHRCAADGRDCFRGQQCDLQRHREW